MIIRYCYGFFRICCNLGSAVHLHSKLSHSFKRIENLVGVIYIQGRNRSSGNSHIKFPICEESILSRMTCGLSDSITESRFSFVCVMH